MSNDILKEALRLAALGLSVLPVKNGTKRPLVAWTPYQTRAADEAQLRAWFENAQDLGLGVVTGNVSGGLTVLDFDREGSYAEWAKDHPRLATLCPTVSTGRGFHVYFRMEETTYTRVFLYNDKHSGEIRGEKSFSVAPPTRHENGRVRAWVVPLTGPPPVLGIQDLGIMVNSRQRPYHDSERSAHKPYSAPAKPFWLEEGVIGEGERNSTLLHLAGRLHWQVLGKIALRDQLHHANRTRCSPPLEEQEVEGIVEWIGAKPPGASSSKGVGEQEEKEFFLHHANPLLREEAETAEYGDLFLDLPEYLAQAGCEDIEWVVEDLFPRGYLVVLGGTAKSGKSCLLTALSMAVATGKPFLGKRTTPGAVLWLALEENEGERAMVLRSFEDRPPGIYTTHERLRFDDPKSVAALRYWVGRTGARLIVVDPLYAATSAPSLGDGRAARAAFEPLKDLCRETGALGILVHHLNKKVDLGPARERLADSNQIPALTSMDIVLDTEESPDGARTLTLRCRGRGGFANKTLVVRSTGVASYELVTEGTGATIEADVRCADIVEALGASPKPLTAQELSLALPYKEATLRNDLTRLVRDKQVEIAGKRGKANLYALPADPGAPRAQPVLSEGQPAEEDPDPFFEAA